MSKFGYQEESVKAELKESVELSVSRDLNTIEKASKCESKEKDSVDTPKLEANSETPPSLGPRYDILGLVGTGGMGTVWKVHDKELGEDFAIKVLKPELVTDETALKRFQKEANLASELTHANIAAIFGPGEDGAGRPYIIMRYVDGESLADILKREGKLSEERAMDIFSQLCEALSHSHMKGIIHRDIKPSNIIISKTESGADLVQLVDFGIARCVYDEVTKTQALTKAVDVFGSPRYMSPEQLLGQEVNAQSDIYSLGVVLYEMLAGEPPFTNENPVSLIISQLNEEADLSRTPNFAKALLQSCLQKNPKLRPNSTEQVAKLASNTDLYLESALSAAESAEIILPLFVVLIIAFISALNDSTGAIVITALTILLFASLFFTLLYAEEGQHSPTRAKKKIGTIAVVSSVLFSIQAVVMTILATKSYQWDPILQYERYLFAALSAATILPLCYLKSVPGWLDTAVTKLTATTVPWKNSKSLSSSKIFAYAMTAFCVCVGALSAVFMTGTPLAILVYTWVPHDLSFTNVLIGYLPIMFMGIGFFAATIVTYVNARRTLWSRSPDLTKAFVGWYLFISVLTFSFHSLILTKTADTGMLDYVKARARTVAPPWVPPYYKSKPIDPTLRLSAMSMVESPPCSVFDDITPEIKQLFEQVENSDLDPLLKAAVLSKSIGAGQSVGGSITPRRFLKYEERKPLISKLFLYLRQSELPSNTKHSNIDELADKWLSLCLLPPTEIERSQILSNILNAAFQWRDTETIREAIGLMSELNLASTERGEKTKPFSEETLQDYRAELNQLEQERVGKIRLQENGK